MQLNTMKTESNPSVKSNKEGKHVKLYLRKILSFRGEKKLLMFNKNRNTKRQRFTKGNNQIIFKYIKLKFLYSQSPIYSVLKMFTEMYPNAEENPLSYP